MSLLTIQAAEVAREHVAAGTDPEVVGDIWVIFADQDHAAGEAFIAAYDAAGGVR